MITKSRAFIGGGDGGESAILSTKGLVSLPLRTNFLHSAT